MTRTKTEWFDTYKVPIPTSIKNLFPDTKAGWRLRNLYTAILIDCNNQDATYTIVNRGIEINLTREDLANIVGTATETLIRLLHDFKEEKLIQTQGRKIRVLDSQKLMRVANLY